MEGWGQQDVQNVYAGLNRARPDKAGWLKPVATAAGAAGGFLVGGPAGAMAGAQLGGAAGGVAHDAVNGSVTPEGLVGDVGQGVAGFNGLNTAMDTRSIIEAFMRNPHAFRQGFANGGLVTGPAMDMASQWAQMDPVQRAMLQAQQAAGPAPVAPIPAQTQQAQHPTLEALSQLLPQIMAAMPRPANPKNTKAIGAWLPAAGLALSAPAAIAQSRRASANAPIEQRNTAAQADYEARRKAYEDRKTKISDTLVGNVTKPVSQTAGEHSYTPEEASAMGHPEWAGMTDTMVRRAMQGKPKAAAVVKPPAPKFDRGALLASALRYNRSGVWDISARDTENRTAAANVAAELRNGGSGDIALNQAQFSADKKSLADLRSATDALTAFEGTALRNSKQLEDRMALITDAGSPILNGAIRDIQAATLGPAELAAFNAARRIVIPEFARILNNPRLSGQLTDTARAEMEEILQGNATIPAILEVLNVLRTDANNRRTENEAQLREVERRIAERGGQSPLSDPVTNKPAIDPTRFIKKKGR